MKRLFVDARMRAGPEGEGEYPRNGHTEDMWVGRSMVDSRCHERPSRQDDERKSFTASRLGKSRFVDKKVNRAS